MDTLDRPGRRADQLVAVLRTFANLRTAGGISELDHALQLATLARYDGVDDMWVLAALCHDIGKQFGDANHGAIAADVLAPHVHEAISEVVRHHTAFTARWWDPAIVDDPRQRFIDRPWYALAEMFVDQWDMLAFDPDARPDPLETFIPLVQELVRE